MKTRAQPFKQEYNTINLNEILASANKKSYVWYYTKWIKLVISNHSAFEMETLNSHCLSSLFSRSINNTVEFCAIHKYNKTGAKRLQTYPYCTNWNERISHHVHYTFKKRNRTLASVFD